MLLTINDMAFSYGVHTIFENLNFRINDKEHVGLIGPNGCGKSTFFKLLTETCHPDRGTINIGRGVTMGILTQEFKQKDHQTLREIFQQAFTPLKLLAQEIQSIQDAIERANEEEQLRLIEKMTALQESYQEKGGFETDSRIRGVTVGLGFTLEDLDKAFGDFSGGEKTRIVLGAKLLENPDLLLLDEPTNYLDFKALNWLESFLNGYTGAFIIISHDRYFLDRVCQRICEIENHSMITYEGNYSLYAEKKRKRDAAMDAAYEKQQKELERQKKIARRLRDYDSLQSNKRAASREKAIAKTELLTHSAGEISLHFSFTPKIVSGYDVLMAEDLSMSFPMDTPPYKRELFHNITFDIHRGERIGIIGPNGIGKTTLFEILMRHLKPDTGKVRYGVKVMPAYYAQEPDEALITPEETLIDALRDIDTHLSDGEIRNILAPFGFRGDTVFRQTGELSGGEKARLRVAQLMISEANLLLMDEPTNHIDMGTREILEDALSMYEGTLVFISHDRYFLNKIADHIFELTPEGMITYEGNYDAYAAWQAKAEAEKNKPQELPGLTKTKQKQERKQQKAIASELRKQKQALKNIEASLESTDARIMELEALMCEPQFYDDPEQAQALTEEYNTAKIRSKALLAEWEELALALEEAL